MVQQTNYYEINEVKALQTWSEISHNVCVIFFAKFNEHNSKVWCAGLISPPSVPPPLSLCCLFIFPSTLD